MDNRRLILLMVFSFSLIMLWDAWQKQSQPKVATAMRTPVSATGAPAGAVPTPTAPAGSGAAPAAVPATAGAVVAGATTAKIKTDLYVADISSLGGDITRLELVRHPLTEDKSKHLVLFDNGGKHIYLAQSGVIGEGLPNHKAEWKLGAGEYVLKDGEQKLEVRMEAGTASGGKVVKTYVFHRGSYQIDVSHEGVTPGAHAYYQIHPRRQAGRGSRQFDDDGGNDFYRAGCFYRGRKVPEGGFRRHSQQQGQVCTESR